MAMHVDYYVSLNSPWTHLGAARLERMVAAHGATLRIYPVDFGAIFAVSGGLPLPKRAPQRQAYRMMELPRWREAVGEPIHIEPKFFPADELPAARAVIAVRETIGDGAAVTLAHRVLKALWQEEENIGDLATLHTLIDEVGLNGAAVMALAADPKWAERRSVDTQRALECGVFGAPSYVIGSEIFWGQDRLEFVQKKLAG